MISRYVSSISTGTVITVSLLYFMQALIALQPGAESDAPLWRPVNFVRVKIPEPTETIKDQPIAKEKLTHAESPPTRTFDTDGLEPINVPTADPQPPGNEGIPVFGSLSDGPLVALVRVAPTYPIRAASLGLEGYVVVQFDVMANGHVSNIVIIESTNSIFDKAAIKAARRFKFKPRVVDGLALTSDGIRNMFRFSLDD
jgi:protein TonB